MNVNNINAKIFKYELFNGEKQFSQKWVIAIFVNSLIEFNIFKKMISQFLASHFKLFSIPPENTKDEPLQRTNFSQTLHETLSFLKKQTIEWLEKVKTAFMGLYESHPIATCLVGAWIAIYLIRKHFLEGTLCPSYLLQQKSMKGKFVIVSFNWFFKYI